MTIYASTPPAGEERAVQDLIAAVEEIVFSETGQHVFRDGHDGSLTERAGEVAEMLAGFRPLRPIGVANLCPALSPSGEACIGRGEYHEVHATSSGTTWRNWAGRSPGVPVNGAVT